MPLVAVLALLTIADARVARAESSQGDTFLSYRIVATHPHDTTAFTQGLAMLDGELVESRGQFGASAVTLGAPATGVARLRRDNQAQHFGEGIAVADSMLLQLTWRAGLAIAYDRHLRPAGTFRYDGEGWGLAFDGRDWLMSDGSDRITRRRRDDFSAIGTLRVTSHGQPVQRLNELEYARGRLYANVWLTDRIAVVDPGSGRVQAWLDLAPLRRGFLRPPGWSDSENVLNGIAFDPATGHFYVTGKRWPVLYEIELAEDD